MATDLTVMYLPGVTIEACSGSAVKVNVGKKRDTGARFAQETQVDACHSLAAAFQAEACSDGMQERGGHFRKSCVLMQCQPGNIYFAITFIYLFIPHHSG